MRLTAVAVAASLLALPAIADPISGYVHANGTVDTPLSLYSVVHTKRGEYSILFTTPFSPKASCLIAPALLEQHRVGARVVSNFAESDTQCSFTMRLADYPNDPIISDFTFIAVAMSN